jgi:hypothetical protein
LIVTQNNRPIGEDTDTLIVRLATQAGAPPTAPADFAAVVTLAICASVLAAAAVVLVSSGARPDLASNILTWTFQAKVIGMMLIGIGALRLFNAAARPGATGRPFVCLAPGAMFMLVGALMDNSGVPLSGPRLYSVPNCVGTIVLASMPALMILLVALRSGTPTQLNKAGAICGLLAGSIGASVYTISCLNDGAVFVGVWYSVAITAVAILGAAVGPLALRW